MGINKLLNMPSGFAWCQCNKPMHSSITRPVLVTFYLVVIQRSCMMESLIVALSTKATESRLTCVQYCVLPTHKLRDHAVS